MNNLKYVTYQSFPAHTANSIQTISNIVQLVKNQTNVDLYFPLREYQSTDELIELQQFYNFEEFFSITGIEHKYPHGKVKYFKKTAYHLSHYFWSKKVVNKYFKKNKEDIFLTRSDWLAYFLAKQGSNVTFECHQTSKLRNFIINKIIGKMENVKFIFLNENLNSYYKNVKNAIVLHNGVDTALYEDNSGTKGRNSILFMGNVTRFEKSRGLDQILTWFCDEEIKNTFTLDIIGAGQSSFKKLEEKIEKLDLSNVVNISGRLSRKNAISSMKRFSTGLLINSPDNPHSYLYTSPIKYFEYLYGGLNILAVDFPSHRSLPLSENISFFQNGDFKSFKNALFDCKTIKPISRESLNSITLDFRAKEIIKFLF
tara:strand:- start:161 stop:1270 length:1110 start_codon:yes stop_codon:yes gene_type:complete